MSSSNEADLQEDSLDLEDNKPSRAHASDEDTEDASEGETGKKDREFTGIKEQMYQDKLAQLKRQVQQLKDGTLPIYMKKMKKLEQQYKERLRLNSLWVKRELEVVQEEYKSEKELANKEFEQKKIELRASLIQELEHKKKMIETERSTMELTGDTMTVKPVTTRKLRRRPNDPLPVPEKRAKPSPVQFTYCIDEQDILSDLMIINKVCGGKSLTKTAQSSAPSLNHGSDIIHDVSVEDGRLCYEKRSFSTDQVCCLESKEHGRFNATIVSISADDIWLKKTVDNNKLRVTISQLQKGQFTIRRRTS